MNTATPGKAVAWIGFALGSVVSTGGNWLAAWLPASHNTPGWTPTVASQVGATVWPIALLVSVEVLARVQWGTGPGWWLVRIGGILLVAGGSAVISYGHIHEVLLSWGYGPVQAGVGPLVIDGLMLISGFALVSIGRVERHADNIPFAALPVDAPTPETPRPPQTSPAEEDERTAVSVTTPPDTVTETAPTTPARPASRPRRRVAGTRRAAAKTTDSLTDEQVITRVRSYRADHGDMPSVHWMRTNLGVGQQRATKLLAQATRPELHTVKGAIG